MKIAVFSGLILFLGGAQGAFAETARPHLTVEELVTGASLPYLQMSEFAMPDGALSDPAAFSGTLKLETAALD